MLNRIQRGGEAFLTNAVIRERFVLRACVVNFHSTPSDAEAVAEIVVRVGREVDGELRPASCDLRSKGVFAGLSLAEGTRKDQLWRTP